MRNIFKMLFFTMVGICSANTFAQDAAILLKNNYKSNDIEFLRNDDRIRVKFKNGDHVVGFLKVIDANTIEIDRRKILLTDVESFKRKSELAGVLEPISYSIGGLTVGLGVVAAAAWPIIGSVILVVCILAGSPFILIPALKRNYHFEDYTFEIQNFQ